MTSLAVVVFGVVFGVGVGVVAGVDFDFYTSERERLWNQQAYFYYETSTQNFCFKIDPDSKEMFLMIATNKVIK